MRAEPAPSSDIAVIPINVQRFLSAGRKRTKVLLAHPSAIKIAE
jgi:hypothetical protein